MVSKVILPELPISGGCQCGRVRYKLNAEPVVFYLCHCTECQRHTSSAFGESLRVRQAELEISGEMGCYARTSDAGRRRMGYFCPSCGVRIVHGTEGSEMVNIKAGTLDDTRWLKPAGHIWTRSRQSFVRIEPDELAYDGQPDDHYAALAARWAEMIAQS